MNRFLALLGLLCSAGVAFGQAAVQQSGVRIDANTNVGFLQSTSAGTLTITPPGGQYAYITGLSIDACENATGTALTNANITSTGIIGLPSWSFSLPVGSTSTCAFGASGVGPVGYGYPATTVAERFATPLKSANAGANVTFVAPTAANVQFTIRAFYYFAP